MAGTGHCPRCGTDRLGNFRFCRMCRFDFDGSAFGRTIVSPDPVELPAPAPDSAPEPDDLSAAAASAPPAPAVFSRFASVDPRVIAGGLGAVLLAVLLIVRPGVPGSVDRSGEVDGAVSIALPPTGTIWFGRTFNPTTFETSGRLSLAGTGDTVAFVGRVTWVTRAMSVRVMVDGVTTALPDTEIRRSDDIVAGKLQLVVGGPLSIEVVDGSGAVLASGTFLVTN